MFNIKSGNASVQSAYGMNQILELQYESPNQGNHQPRVRAGRTRRIRQKHRPQPYTRSAVDVTADRLPRPLHCPRHSSVIPLCRSLRLRDSFRHSSPLIDNPEGRRISPHRYGTACGSLGPNRPARSTKWIFETVLAPQSSPVIPLVETAIHVETGARATL